MEKIMRSFINKETGDKVSLLYVSEHEVTNFVTGFPRIEDARYNVIVNRRLQLSTKDFNRANQLFTQLVSHYTNTLCLTLKN